MAILVKHIFQSHSADPLFTFPCPFANCPYVFKPGSTYFSFQSHAQRKHPNWNEELSSLPATTSQEPESAASSVQLQSTDERYQLDEHVASTQEEVSTLPQIQVSTGPSTVSQSAAQFLLTLKEKYRLTQAAVDFAVGLINQIVSHVCDELHRSVGGILQESHNVIPATLDEAFTPIQPFEGLTTEYQQSKYYREHFGLVVSVHVH